MLSSQLDVENCHPGTVIGSPSAGHDPDIRFGAFRLLLRERRLERDGVAVALGGRAMDILAELVSRAGEVVSKAELSQAAWPGMLVEEGSLRFHIGALRRALGDGGRTDGMLKTVAGRGYCFTAAVVNQPVARPWAETQQPPRNFHAWRRRRPVGLDQAVQEAATVLTSRRFLTLVGSAGVGKTTLARELCQNLECLYPHGIAIVDLGTIAGSQAVTNAVARALGISPQEDADIQCLLPILEGRQLLLVLDGCERLIDAVAEIAEALSRHSPGISILATSRESLRVDGEYVYRMMPLACPPEGIPSSAEQVLAYPAVELFVERVRAGRYGYELRDEEAGAVSEICRKLDGIPLAIELVASRAATCGLAQTLTLMSSHMRLLWRGWRTAPARHQTLNAALDWSYDLLSATEQRTFRSLGVFDASFSLAEAQAVAADDELCRDSITQVIADLVARSLVVSNERDGEYHYRLLDMTRGYALSKLRDSEEANIVILRHAKLVLDAVDAHAPLAGFFARASEGPVDDWLDDLRAALRWNFARGGDNTIALSITAAAAPLMIALGFLDEYLDWTSRALECLGDSTCTPLGVRLQTAHSLALTVLESPIMTTEEVMQYLRDVSPHEMD